MENTNTIANTKKAPDVKYLVMLGLLTGILILFAFTPLGYLHVGVIEITFNMIPVVIGAIILGPAAGAVLGGVFGITSFIQCFGMSPFGALLLGINPFTTFIICMVPRILCGLLAGVIFKALYRFDKTKLVSYAVASISGALLNTLFFVGGVIIFFWNNTVFTSAMTDSGLPIGKGILAFFIAFVGVNGLIEACVTLVIGGAIARILPKSLKRINK